MTQVSGVTYSAEPSFMSVSDKARSTGFAVRDLDLECADTTYLL